MPRHAPPTRDVWTEWTKLWPIVWRQPDFGPVALRPEAAIVDAAEIERMRQQMQRAWQLAVENRSAGGAFNAAVIVDPAQGANGMLIVCSTNF